jgi:hypothetical protein
LEPEKGQDELLEYLKGQDRKNKKLALEIAAFWALIESIDTVLKGRVSRKEDGEHKLKCPRSRPIWTAYWPSWGLTMTYHRNNNMKQTSFPDFDLAHHNNGLLAIECKNVNPDFEVGKSNRPNGCLSWLRTDIIRRFKEKRYKYGYKKLVIFSFFQLVPDPNCRDEVVTTLEAEQIEVRELGEQPLKPDFETAEKLKPLLEPFLAQALGNLKPPSHRKRLSIPSV